MHALQQDYYQYQYQYHQPPGVAHPYDQFQPAAQPLPVAHERPVAAAEYNAPWDCANALLNLGDKGQGHDSAASHYPVDMAPHPRAGRARVHPASRQRSYDDRPASSSTDLEVRVQQPTRVFQAAQRIPHPMPDPAPPNVHVPAQPLPAGPGPAPTNREANSVQPGSGSGTGTNSNGVVTDTGPTSVTSTSITPVSIPVRMGFRSTSE